VGGAAGREGPLRLNDVQVRRISAVILSRWKAKGLIHPKAADEAIVAKMAGEIRKDLQREEELDREAEAVLDRHVQKIDPSQANTRILFQKIKERLAKDRGIVL
jgi:hypothetical protein